MQPSEKKRFFIFAGIGFVATGIASIVVVYALVYQPLLNQDEEINTRMTVHIHVSLVLTRDSKLVEVPGKIDVDPELWRDHSLDSYGIGDLSPMHTHDASGTIQIESLVGR